MHNIQTRNIFVFSAIGSLGLILLALTICFPLSFYGLLPLFVIAATVLITFGSLRYGIYGPLYFLMILIPYSQSVTIFNITGREVNVGMHTTVVCLIILIMIIVKRFRIPIIKEPPTSVLFLLGLWTFLTIVVAIISRSGLSISNSIVTWIRWIQFIPIVYFITSFDIDTKYIKNFVKIFIWLGIITAFWGIIEVATHTDLEARAFRGAVTFTRPLFRELDLASSFGDNGFYRGSANYNVSGAFMVIVTFITLPFLRTRVFFNTRIISFLLILLLLVGIAVTKSRSSVLAFIGGIAFYAYSYSAKKFLNVMFAFLVVVIVFFTFFSNYWLGPMIIDTIDKLPDAMSIVKLGEPWNSSMGFNMNVYGAAMRWVAIKEAFRIFLDSPIFGVGFFGFSSASILGTSENFYMQFLSETGIIGFGLLMMYFYYVWDKTKTKFLKGSFEDNYQIGFRSVFIVFLIVNFTGTLMYDTRIWGLLLILSAIQIYNVKKHKFIDIK